MAKKSLKVKCARPAKFSTRNYTRCQRCGRPHANSLKQTLHTLNLRYTA